VQSPSIRRLLFALLFPLLLIAQQGPFVHSLEHLPSIANTSKSQDDRHTRSDQYCEKCFAFAQIGATADHLPTFAAVPAGAFEAIGFRLPLAPLPKIGFPRSRGPPPLL
jgi:hypothetical protein